MYLALRCKEKTTNMKTTLTKPTLIEGKVIPKGTQIRVVQVNEKDLNLDVFHVENSERRSADRVLNDIFPKETV